MSSTVYERPACRMLLVDDNPLLRNSMRLLLRPFFEVQAAQNGREAQRWFAKQRFDVAFVDYMLPDIDGLEVLRRLRLAAPRVGRIITSDWFLPELFSLGANGLIQAFVLRPTSLDAIVEVCRSTVDDRSRLPL